MNATGQEPGTTMRDRILAAAAEEFAELGFDGARVDSIAQRAQVGKAMVYYHVGDKASLYETVFSNCLDRARAVLDQPEPGGSDPRSRLRRFVRAVVTAASEDPGFPPLLLREVAAGGANLPAPVIERIGFVFEAIRKVLMDGQTEGAFRPADPQTVHALIGGGVMFFAASAALRRRLVDLGALSGEGMAAAGDLVDEISDLFLNGLVVRRDGEQPRGAAGTGRARPRGTAGRRRRRTADINKEK